ncbi:MAG: substrate-binding domain-containing protein, partial [Planctomycetota bacterium]
MHTNRFTLWAMGAERRQRLVWVTINVGAPAVRDVLAGMRAAAREAGNVVLRLVTPQTMGSVPPRVDGLIGRILERPLQSFAKRKPAVSVYSTGHPDPCRAVYSDPVAASRMAVDHLLERDLHHLRTYLATRVIGARRVRAERFEQFAADAGADVQRHEADDPAEGPGNHKTLRQLTRWLARQPLPLGVMAIDDWHALRVIEACGEAGLRVPGDVAVLGHNDDAGV